MLLYEFQLAEQAKNLQLNADSSAGLSLKGADQTAIEFQDLEAVKNWMKAEGIKCRHVFASECAYGMGMDESYFRELLADAEQKD